jgi:hypothetical protein
VSTDNRLIAACKGLLQLPVAARIASRMMSTTAVEAETLGV